MRRPSSTSLPATVVCGVVVAAAATAFRAWGLQGTWWFYDDFYFLQRALSHDLTVGFAMTPYNGHLMPAGVVTTWLNTHVDLLGHGLVRAEILVLVALTNLAMLRLLVTLFGPRPGILVPLVLFAFSPALLPTTSWYAAAVNQAPMLLTEILALDAFVRHLRTRSRRSLLLSVLWLAVGLLFVERTILVLLPMWLVALMYFASGTFPERLASTWRTYRTAALTHGVAALGYLAGYFAWAANFDARSVVSRPFFEVLHDLVAVAFSSGFVGGPVRWEVSEVTQSNADPPQPVLYGSWVVIVVLLVVVARSRRRGLRAWLLPLASLLSCCALLSVSRAVYFGPSIALDYRFQTEVALTAALAVGLSFLPLLGAVESSEPVTAPTPGASTFRLDTPAWAVPALAVFLVLATVSTQRFPLRNLTTTSPEAYLANVSASDRERPRVQVLDLQTPPWIWAPLAYPTNTYSHIFPLVRSTWRFSTTPTDETFVVDSAGSLRSLDFEAARALTPARAQGTCAHVLDPGSSTWRLDGPVFGIGWYARIVYTAPRPTSLRVSTASGATHTVRLRAGLHTVLVPVTGQFVAVRLRTPATAPRTCLNALQIGQVSPGERASSS